MVVDGWMESCLGSPLLCLRDIYETLLCATLQRERSRVTTQGKESLYLSQATQTL